MYTFVRTTAAGKDKAPFIVKHTFPFIRACFFVFQLQERVYVLRENPLLMEDVFFEGRVFFKGKEDFSYRRKNIFLKIMT